MPPSEPHNAKSLHDIVGQLGIYPLEAFEFIQQGLSYTVQKIHGQLEDEPQGDEEVVNRHVSGQQLCYGLRDYALERWGLMARTVLARWNITSTYDFGRIVFALVEGGRMQKTDDDDINDFRNVFEFRSAFDTGYRIECKS